MSVIRTVLPESECVKLYHCPNHDNFHLRLNKAVAKRATEKKADRFAAFFRFFHITPRERLLLGAAINRWWHEHPEQVDRIAPFDFTPTPNGSSH